MENAPKNFSHNSLPRNVNYSDISVFVFDKDDTISEPNKPLDVNIANQLADLTRSKNVVILTARDFETCKTQILDVIWKFNPCLTRFVLGCSNGSQIYKYNCDESVYECVSELDGIIELADKKSQILSLANDFFGRDDMVLEQRSNTMGAIFPPRTLSTEERKVFDPTGKKRKRFIEKIRELEIFPQNYEIISGGSTSVDIGLHDKEAWMRHLIDFFGYNGSRHGEILFMGDGFPWNDSPVLNVDGINVVRVDDCIITAKLLGKILQDKNSQVIE